MTGLENSNFFKDFPDRVQLESKCRFQVSEIL